jgi:tetratricopeptide (TPR) repeat protein
MNTMTKAVTAALVDQQGMLAKTETPFAQTPASALEPTELTPPMPSDKPARRSALAVGLIVVLAAVVLAIGLPLFWPGGGKEPPQPDKQEGPDKTTAPAAPVEEGPPKLAVAEFIVEGDAGTNTSMSLANTIVYRAKKVVKDRYKIVEPLELKGILESLGMKVAQLTDYEASKRLYTERGIRYLILCTLVKGAGIDLRGKMLDLKDGTVMQHEEPFVRHSGDIRYRVELLGDVLTLDDTHKKIYYLLDEARLDGVSGKYEDAMAKFAEALKLDPKDETIPEAKKAFTERLAKDAINKADWRTYDKVYELFEAANKYNFAPETVKKLPEELVQVLLKEGDQDLDRKNYEKALEAFRCAAKIKEDPVIRDKIKQTENLMQDTIEEFPGKGGKSGKGYYEEPYGKGGKGGK